MADRPNVAGKGEGVEAAVLVIEDDRSTRDLLAAILTEEELPFHITASGHEAMSYALGHPPGMVVLDMHLPNIQGEAIATALRIQCGQGLPILMTSAADERAQASRLGAFAYLQKPFEIDAFVLLVRRGLDLASRPDDLRHRAREARERLRGSMVRQRAAFNDALASRSQQPPGPTAAAR